MTYTPRYTPDLTTLEYLRAQRELQASATSSDALLTQYIHAISAKIQQELNRTCMPYLATKSYDYTSDNIWNARTLQTHDDLLSVTTLTNADSTIASSAFVLRPNNVYPRESVLLKSGNSWSSGTEIIDAVSIVGEWGYVPHINSNAWTLSSATVAADITDSATTLTVSDGSVLQTLQYIRLESEIVQITNISTNTLTITRAELGTTAAAHLVGAAIDKFTQLRDLQDATAQTVSYLYKTQQATGSRVRVYEGGVLEVQELDPMVREIIARHKRYRSFSA